MRLIGESSICIIQDRTKLPRNQKTVELRFKYLQVINGVQRAHLKITNQRVAPTKLRIAIASGKLSMTFEK